MSVITVDVPPWFKEAMFKNSLQMAEEQANMDVKEIVRRGEMKVAKEAIDDFEEKKCAYESAEQALYAAKWTAEERIRNVQR